MKHGIKFIFFILFIVATNVLIYAQKNKPQPVKIVKVNNKPLTNIHPVAPSKDTMLLNANEWQLYTNTADDTQHDRWLINKLIERTSSDALFYLLAGLLALLGIIRVSFPKYFNDLFMLFFRVTFKQKAIRERLLENTLPSMLLNVLFFFSGGFFLFYVSKYYQWSFKDNFWYGMGFWLLVLACVYSGKLLLLKAMGWLFQMQEISNTYSFIIFMVNKVIGVLLTPIVILLALGPVFMQPVLITIAIFLLVAMFIYRYIISYPSVRTTVRINQFHFFLYLCAFEIVPMLLIYKVLAIHFSNATRL